MAYASIEDVWKRKGTDISDTDYVTALLEDAAIIIDAYNHNATDEAKKLVSCNMVIRTLGSREEGVPIGTTQTTTTAMVYSQTWTKANGSGELYLTKLDKKILGVGNRIGYFNPYSDLMQEEEANDLRNTGEALRTKRKWDRYIRTSDIYRDTCDRGRRVGCSGIDNRSAGYA